MASYRNENRPDSGDLLSWIITIVLLVSPVWPIGLITVVDIPLYDLQFRMTGDILLYDGDLAFNRLPIHFAVVQHG